MLRLYRKLRQQITVLTWRFRHVALPAEITADDIFADAIIDQQDWYAEVDAHQKRRRKMNRGSFYPKSGARMPRAFS